jgi:hypothetical protein
MKRYFFCEDSKNVREEFARTPPTGTAEKSHQCLPITYKNKHNSLNNKIGGY